MLNFSGSSSNQVVNVSSISEISISFVLTYLRYWNSIYKVINMKSKQTKICKIFILVLLTLQLSSAIPISKKRTSKQQSCQSWLASKVDHKIVPAQIADRYRLFALRDSTSLKELQDVGSLLKNGRVCNGLGDASNLQVVFESNQEMKSNQLQSEVGVCVFFSEISKPQWIIN